MPNALSGTHVSAATLRFTRCTRSAGCVGVCPRRACAQGGGAGGAHGGARRALLCARPRVAYHSSVSCRGTLVFMLSFMHFYFLGACFTARSRARRSLLLARARACFSVVLTLYSSLLSSTAHSSQSNLFHANAYTTVRWYFLHTSTWWRWGC